MDNLIQTLAISILPVVFAITLHEAAHGYVARHFGDLTAWQAGRISLNPLRHIDPVGTVVLPLLTMVLGGFVFGWAKPVPVRFDRLRHPKRDMFWVALAGPAANLAMVFGWGLLGKLAETAPENSYTLPLARMSDVGIEWNIVLMVLNLLPILPLDGGRIAVSLLPHRAAWQYSRLEPWGLPILVVLLATGILGGVMGPVIGLLRYAFSLIFQFHY